MNLETTNDTTFQFEKNQFGEDFIWGVLSSTMQSYVTIGKESKSLSICDEFSNNSGVLSNNDYSSFATNLNENYKEEIALVKKMGITNFRFSLSWSRIVPNGIGKSNQSAIDFYHNVLDECHKQGVEPFVTLYQCDLPHELEKMGGWTNREILQWFENYVSICINEFKGKIKNWIVLNEPSVFIEVGYFFGVPTSGKKGLNNFLPVLHHALLCQSIGYKKIKEIDSQSQVGTTFSYSYIIPNTYTDKDIKVTERVDTLLHSLFIEPSLGLGYPFDKLPFLKGVTKYIFEGDNELIKADFDFIVLQNYKSEVIKHNFYVPYLNAKIISSEKRKVNSTKMNGEIHSKSIYYMIKRYSQYGGVKKIIITENNTSFFDEVNFKKVDDTERIQVLQSHLEQVLSAKRYFGKIAGYFALPLTDNFERAEGYKNRSGVIHFDFNTPKSTIKNSGNWFSNFLSKNDNSPL
jgi:beta-glucosidase